MSSIQFDSVLVHDRARKKENYGDLTGLIESIRSLGTIHPIVLNRRPDGVPELVAGGRRYECLANLGCKELFEASTCDPTKPGFIWAENLSDDVRKEAELDENLHRLGMQWIDEVLLVADVHEQKKAKNLKWGQVQTAALLGKAGLGKSNVNYALSVAKELRAGNKDLFKGCSTLSEATQVLMGRQQDLALAELQKRANAIATPGPTVAAGMIDVFSQIISPKKDFSQLQAPVQVDPLKAATEQITGNTGSSMVEIPLSRMFFLGDFREVCKVFADASFDHVITDIPYGIDMDNVDLKNIADIAPEHDVEENVSLFEPFLSTAFRLVRPGGFCVFFYDLDHHNRLQTIAKDVGWRLQRWPLEWVKTHPCKNQAPAYNFTKATEYAMVLRKDEKTVLRKPVNINYWSGDGSAERAAYGNPFAKPSGLWRFIYESIAFVGQSVFDPFWGEGSASRTAANMGLLPYGCEKTEKRYNRGVEGMRAVYALIHKSNVKFT